MNNGPEPRRDLQHAVRLRHARRQRWAREGERSLAQNLALIGALGWTIVVPTLIGVFVGRWLDARFASPPFWTLSLLVLGLGAGCAMAWQGKIGRATVRERVCKTV